MTSNHTGYTVFRMADIASSMLAFLAAHAALPTVESILRRLLPASGAVTAFLSPAPANGPTAPWIEMSWLFAVATIAMALATEYTAAPVPLYARRLRQVVFAQLFAFGAAVGAVATVFY